MKIVTKHMMKTTPSLGSTENVSMSEKILHTKLFTPWGNWTWYICEANFETGECFGLVEGFEKEWGYFNLFELQQIRGPMGLKVERERAFQPRKYGQGEAT